MDVRGGQVHQLPTITFRTKTAIICNSSRTAIFILSSAAIINRCRNDVVILHKFFSVIQLFQQIAAINLIKTFSIKSDFRIFWMARQKRLFLAPSTHKCDKSEQYIFFANVLCVEIQNFPHFYNFCFGRFSLKKRLICQQQFQLFYSNSKDIH